MTNSKTPPLLSLPALSADLTLSSTASQPNRYTFFHGHDLKTGEPWETARRATPRGTIVCPICKGEYPYIQQHINQAHPPPLEPTQRTRNTPATPSTLPVRRHLEMSSSRYRVMLSPITRPSQLPQRSRSPSPQTPSAPVFPPQSRYLLSPLLPTQDPVGSASAVAAFPSSSPSALAAPTKFPALLPLPPSSPVLPAQIPLPYSPLPPPSPTIDHQSFPNAAIADPPIIPTLPPTPTHVTTPSIDFRPGLRRFALGIIQPFRVLFCAECSHGVLPPHASTHAKKHPGMSVDQQYINNLITKGDLVADRRDIVFPDGPILPVPNIDICPIHICPIPDCLFITTSSKKATQHPREHPQNSTPLEHGFGQELFPLHHGGLIRVQYTEAPPPSLPPARPSEALERTLAQNPHIIQRRLGTAPSARDIDPFVTQSNWLTRTSGWTTATVQGMKDRMVATPRLREECIALLGHLRQSIRHDDYTLLALLQTHDPSVSSDCSSIVTLTLTLFPLGANPRPHHSPSSRSPQM